MTRTYAMKQLLAHGPLSHAELLEVTGWSKKQVAETTCSLVKRRYIKFQNIDGVRKYLIG